MEQRSLAWLLQPLTVETFLKEIWGATHYHVSRNCAEFFDGLLDSSASVDELLGLFRPDLSLVRLVREDAKRTHMSTGLPMAVSMPPPSAKTLPTATRSSWKVLSDMCGLLPCCCTPSRSS